MRKSRIVQAADAVAYLPLYAAEVSGRRLQLADGSVVTWSELFDEPYRNPPQEFLGHITVDEHRTGDQGCLNAIVAAWDRFDKTPLIGICDPCNIVHWHSDKLVMVGGLINRACFWCLTDKDTEATGPTNLRVDALFIHKAGLTTGNEIGLEVLRRMPGSGSGPLEPKTGSFDLLVDGAVDYRRRHPDKRVAAITASVLSCVIAKERGGFKIAFPLHDLPEYDEFLTTAIVVHREALKDRDVRKALMLLLKSLRSAREEVETKEQMVDEIVKLSKGRFENERRIDCAEVVGSAVLKKGPVGGVAEVTVPQAREVWRLLTERSIYSKDARVRQREWDNAFRARRTDPPPLLSRFYDESLVAESEKLSFAGTRIVDAEGFARRTRWIAVGSIIAALAGLLFELPTLLVAIAMAAAIFAILWPYLRDSSLLTGGGPKQAVMVLAASAYLLVSFCVFSIALIAGLTANGDEVVTLGKEWPSFVSETWNHLAKRIHNSVDPLLVFGAGVPLACRIVASRITSRIAIRRGRGR